MSPTVLERDMLKTRIDERDMSVTTYLRPGHSPGAGPGSCPPWTVVCEGAQCHYIWLHFWRGATTAGGLAEAHASIVARVARGEMTAQGPPHDQARRGEQ